MRFSTRYPDFAAIEEHVRRARIERAVVISQGIVAAVQWMVGGFKAIAARVGQAAVERERRAIEADAFLKRSVPRY